MSDERRYQDEEIRAIFEAATEAATPIGAAPGAGRGLTLADLQQIGVEVGLSPERVAAAARALDRTPALPPRRTYLGMPVAISRTVDLPRAPTDREWALLVGELRQTFRARGRAESGVDLREWRNGNLHASVEPTETGYRLRLGTMKTSAAPTAVAGAAAMVWGLILFLIMLLTGNIPEGVATPALLVAVGGAVAGSTVMRLPGWAREREQQMDYIAGRALALLGRPPAEVG